MKSTVNKIEKVTSNQSLRHFTLIKTDGTKYRTTPMSREEFNRCEYNTLNDWENFLQNGDYSKVN